MSIGDKLMDPKLQMILGVVARLVPKDEYAKMAVALGQLVALGKSLEDRLKAIEANTQAAANRIAMLEAVVMNKLDGASELYSEALQWAAPGRIEKALAPATNGALQHDDGNAGG